MTLKDRIINVGIENCLFIVPMKPIRSILGFKFTNSNDPEYNVPCRIDESRYKIDDNYKITLICDYQKEFGKESYYLSDLQLMINRGTIEFYIKSN